MRLLLAILVSLMVAWPALAVAPDEVLADSVLEARARSLSAELRCLVCQNQSIDDSDAELARELRLIVREQLAAGASDQQVRDFLVARYGEFVLLKPVFAWHTALLWIAPGLLLLIGIVALAWAALRGRRGKTAGLAPTLSESEKAALQRLSSEG